jgi:peptidoglycan hydrolase-like protein with peptidoglycan-binding domain
MFRHLGRLTIQVIAGVILLSGSKAFAVEGPSFDCSHGVRQTLAVILCVNPEAAQADWDLNSAYWALFTDDREETTFNEAVNERCALPPLETQQERDGRVFIQEFSRRMLGPGLLIPTPQPLTEQHVRCVISMFHNRAATLRGRLTGDALAESNLSPDEHIEIQVALASKGFLQNRVRSYGANADGEFGPNTRSAIKDYQRSIGAQATGFLSNEQRITLIENPEEREARAARAAAQEKARQEAVEAQKRAEEQAKQAALDQEKKRLEDEAAKAAEWRRKIDEAQKRGAEYAKASDLKWSLLERTNPMTDEQDYAVSSAQTNGAGALAEVDGLCSSGQVLFEATLHDASDSKVPLGFARSSAGGIIGRKRINDDLVFATNFPLDKWGNRIVLSRLSFREDDAESADTTWRVLAEIETSQGTLYIKIPILDSNIQKLIAACKRQYEIEKRRQGPPNAPG